MIQTFFSEKRNSDRDMLTFDILTLPAGFAVKSAQAGVKAGQYVIRSKFSFAKIAQAMKNATSKLPSTRAALRKDLENKGFSKTGSSTKYEVWKKDATGDSGQTVVTIKPTGEVIRTQKVWKQDKSGKYSERQDYYGNRLEDQSHSTGHYVK